MNKGTSSGRPFVHENVVLELKLLPKSELRSDFLNLAVADAGCARTNASAGTGHHRADTLQVDVPAAVGHVMCVTDFVTKLRTFAANFANSCHGKGRLLISLRAAQKYSRTQT